MPGRAPFQITSPLSFFNGPPDRGQPTLIAHAYETVPAPQAMLVPITIERVAHGRYGFRAEVQIPEIAGGYGAAILAEAKIGAIRKRGGREVGYINAHCVGGRLQVQGKAEFTNGDSLPGHPDLAMPLAKVARATVLALAIALLASASAAGEGALVEVNDIVLRADGGFEPHTLPRRQFAPIDFQGHVDISARRGAPLSPLQQALIDFDRDGRLSVAGLPTCAPETIAQLGTEGARRACRGAIVGTGHVAAAISLLGAAVQTRAPLTIFNGPRLATGPSVVLHARTLDPPPRNVRDPRPDRTPPRRLPLPRPDRAAAAGGRPRRSHPHRRQDRPPLPRRRALPQLRLRPLQRQHPADPRRLHLRRRHRDLRRGRKVLQRQVAAAG